ncbi:MAG: hypothetical protein U1F57_01375 [bacterium]
MSFQALEKRLEAYWEDSSLALRGLSRTFWEEVVAKSRARVLSRFSGISCDAYLLSESSLFVWDRRIVMITCGRSELHRAFRQITSESLSRLPAVFSFETPLHDSEDERFFKNLPKTRSILLGNEGAPFFWASNGNLNSPRWKWTLEGLDESSQSFFAPETSKAKTSIFRKLGWDSAISGALENEHAFDPMGYSLNLLKDERYAALHVTPEAPSSYASFEGNLTAEEIIPPLNSLLEKTLPRRIQLLSFTQEIEPFPLSLYRLEENTLHAPEEGIKIRKIVYRRK